MAVWGMLSWDTARTIEFQDVKFISSSEMMDLKNIVHGNHKDRGKIDVVQSLR